MTSLGAAEWDKYVQFWESSWQEAALTCNIRILRLNDSQNDELIAPYLSPAGPARSRIATACGGSLRSTLSRSSQYLDTKCLQTVPLTSRLTNIRSWRKKWSVCALVTGNVQCATRPSPRLDICRTISTTGEKYRENVHIPSLTCPISPLPQLTRSRGHRDPANRTPTPTSPTPAL